MIEAATLVAMANMNPVVYLNERSNLRRRFMEKVAERFATIEDEQWKRRAEMIANEVMKGLGGK